MAGSLGPKLVLPLLGATVLAAAPALAQQSPSGQATPLPTRPVSEQVDNPLQEPQATPNPPPPKPPPGPAHAPAAAQRRATGHPS